MKDKIKVLIADDNLEFAMTLNEYLEKENEMEILGMAKDGNEAYNMILSDLQAFLEIFSNYFQIVLFFNLLCEFFFQQFYTFYINIFFNFFYIYLFFFYYYLNFYIF